MSSCEMPPGHFLRASDSASGYPSPTLQLAVASVQLNDYAARMLALLYFLSVDLICFPVVAISAIGYDYCEYYYMSVCVSSGDLINLDISPYILE